MTKRTRKSRRLVNIPNNAIVNVQQDPYSPRFLVDKKTAKIFGFKEGHEIKFTEFQTFLKNIYDSVSKNEVEL
jgi:hypothetical protein